MTREVSNSDDLIDSRDVIARIEELRDDKGSWVYNVPWAEAHPDLAEELAALKALAEEAYGCADWAYGETLVRDSYFETYAQELAEECGMMRDKDSWPYTCIDWEQAARELKHDYTCVDFDGIDYWVRS